MMVTFSARSNGEAIEAEMEDVLDAFHSRQPTTGPVVAGHLAERMIDVTFSFDANGLRAALLRGVDLFQDGVRRPESEIRNVEIAVVDEAEAREDLRVLGQLEG
jgi:hypothetical protein